MSWDDIYRKWGISEAGIAGLNVVTWLALAVAAVIAGLLILGAVGEWIKSLKKTDEKEKSHTGKKCELN